MGGGFPVLQLIPGELGECFKATTTDIDQIEGKATGYRRRNMVHCGARATCAISGSEGGRYGAGVNRRGFDLRRL